jgi:DNA-binding GntR family transcriptional regulator
MAESTEERDGRTVGAAPRLYAQAERILAEDITNGRIAAGTRLFESRVARRFGISRAPARQALAALAKAGLTAGGDGRGYVVQAVARGAACAGEPCAPCADAPLEAAATWERIYRQIELAIISRTAFGSWRVVESELATTFSVSRTVARDVIARLNQRGIVRKDPKGRWIAPGLTPEHVGELYEMRWVVEPAALLNAYPRIPKAAITAAVAHIDTALARGADLDGASLDALESELHGDLIGYCGNRTMLESLRSYQSLLVAHSFLYELMPQIYGVEPFLDEHRDILVRLDAGHVADAASALERHLRVSLERANHRVAAVARHLSPAPLAYLQPISEHPSR